MASSDDRATDSNVPTSGEPSDAASDRAAILKRRATFVTKALATLSVTLAAACGDDSEPQPCLDVYVPEGGGGQGGAAQGGGATQGGASAQGGAGGSTQGGGGQGGQ